MSAAPRVSMLWEATDPATALKERFGFENAGAAVAWLSEVLASTWGRDVDHCEQIVMSAGNLLAWIRSGDRRLIAKSSMWPPLFRRLSDTTVLTAWVQDQGIPVAAPIPARDGRLRVELGGVSLGLFPVVSGDLLDTDHSEQVVEAGHMLARLHTVLAGYPHHVDGGQPALGQQLVQGDFRSANILHDGTSITAVLDFEEAAYRPRVDDLARAAVLLSTRYHQWRPTTLDVRSAFIAAYAEQAPLTGEEQDELPGRIDAVLQGLGWT